MTFCDRFKKIVADHRLAVRNNAVAPGIIKIRGQGETFLDDGVLEMDEWEEERRTERDRWTELEKRLLVAGEHIRAKVVGRRRRDEEDEGAEPKRNFLMYSFSLKMLMLNVVPETCLENIRILLVSGRVLR